MSSVFSPSSGRKNAVKGARDIINQFPQSFDVVAGHSGLFDTGRSTVSPVTGDVNIDPTGRNILTSSFDNLTANLGETRGGLLGNRGAFQQARVNPLLERLSAGRGQLERGLGQTGVRGTFRDQSLQNFDINAARAEADARALAEQETLGAINQLDLQQFAAGQGTGAQLFEQELQSLGLAADTVSAIKAIAANLTTGAGSTGSSIAQTQAGINKSTLGAVGGLFSGGASFF